jgi:ABC-type tungstate transport system substrate-binding protein
MGGGFVDAAHSALGLLWHADARLAQVVGLSLVVSGTACVIASVVGMALGAWVAVARFAGRGVLIATLNTLLALPSVVVGLVVYLLLSRAGPLGSLGILFTPTAMVVAQTILTLPLVAALTRQLVADAWQGNGEQLRSMGARPLVAAGLLLLHERVALVTIVLTAFGRAVSEVGAVMIVGGNIDGVTRVMTTTIALETSKGDLPLALGLGLVLLGVVGLLNAVVALLQRRQRGTHEAARVALGTAP